MDNNLKIILAYIAICCLGFAAIAALPGCEATEVQTRPQRSLRIHISLAEMNSAYGVCPEGREIVAWDADNNIHSTRGEDLVLINPPQGILRTATRCGSRIETPMPAVRDGFTVRPGWQ